MLQYLALTCTLLLGASLFQTMVASAQTGEFGPDCRGHRTGPASTPQDEMECLVTKGEASRGGASAGSPQGGSEPSKRYVPYERLTTNPHGEPCITTGYREVPEGTGPEEAILRLPDQDFFGSILAEHPRCPEEQSPGQETPAQIAARYWERIPLPKPAPHIGPGWAITGKLAYLETKGQTRHAYTNSTIAGPLEIVATGTYYVDWGDGHTSGPHSFEGKPWPDGEITHEYQWVGTYNVVVTERWTATWRLGGQNGTLRELRTTGRIDNFPVRQVQAVIR